MSNLAWVFPGVVLACVFAGCNATPAPEGGKADSLVGKSGKEVIARLGKPKHSMGPSLCTILPGTYSDEKMRKYRARTTRYALYYDDVIIRINLDDIVTHVTIRDKILSLVGRRVEDVAEVLGEPEGKLTVDAGHGPFYVEFHVTVNSDGLVTAVR
jgi:hypothetical protein